MNVAIFHHHLNRGGVTQVIVNHLRTLDAVVDAEPINVNLFFGGRQAAWPDNIADELKNIRLTYVELEQLDYDEVRDRSKSHADLADLIVGQLALRGLSAENCLLHFHNHNLGKNWELIAAIDRLQSSGFRMLLQLHDFAEDFRPENFRNLKQNSHDDSADLVNVLYPSSSNVMFAVINQRDGSRLNRLGIDSQRIKYLPNPVTAITGMVEPETAKSNLARYRNLELNVPFLVYPVRGIRRKNIGEAVLLPLLSRNKIQVGLTLRPLNPQEIPSYETWKELARQLRLPVLFELGTVSEVSFAEILSAADQILTTSVTEGFGMTFLEALAINKPLIGRNIPEITSDFVDAGISFPNLYNEIRVPIESISLADYRMNLVDMLERLYREYERPFSPTVVDEIISEAEAKGWIDFGKLPQPLQIDFVRSAFVDGEVRDRLQKLNSEYSTQLSAPTIEETLTAANRNRVQDRFSFERIGKQILGLYEQLLEVNPETLPGLGDSDSLVSDFLDARNMFPVRLASSDCQQPANIKREWAGVIVENSQPLEPISTKLEPRLQTLDDVQVVLFDIYGTLLVSSSGDIGTDQNLSRNLSSAQGDPLHVMLAELGLTLDEAGSQVERAIRQKHAGLRDFGTPYPEIDIVFVWKQLVTAQAARSTSTRISPLDWPTRRLQELALRFELATNPVFPMPGMQDIIRAIGKKGIKLGIISNAQFYTPLIVEAFCDQSLEELGFDRELIFFSYCFGRAKPDLFLYQHANAVITDLGYLPEQVLYVGNDMTKDVVPAKHVGFKTGLFAGDQRSLRLGQHTLPLTPTSVDLILKELTQIDECLSTST